MPRKAKYNPIPTKIVARLVNNIARRVSMPMDTSGCLARRSHSHQPVNTAIPLAVQPSVAGEVQPHEMPWVIANKIADRPAPRPAAPSQSMVPFDVRARAGTSITTMAMTTMVNAVVSQKTR
jgi:hypothetical protein